MGISEHLPKGNSEGQYPSECVSYEMLSHIYTLKLQTRKLQVVI